MFQIKNRVTHFNAWAMQIVLAAKTAQRLLGGHTPLYTLLILKVPQWTLNSLTDYFSFYFFYYYDTSTKDLILEVPSLRHIMLPVCHFDLRRY